MERLAASLLILSGPPGAGKSTVAPLVAAVGDPAVRLESDWFWTTFVNGFVEPWLPAADAQNRAVLRAAIAAASALADGGIRVVLDGLVGPWMIDIITDELGRRGQAADFVILRPPLDVCLARAAARADDPPKVPGHPPLTDVDAIRHMWNEFAELGTFERHVIDNGAWSAEHSATRVLDAIADGSFRLR